MSVLIQQSGGFDLPSNNSTTNPDSSEGPDHFWAGLRLACPVWKTKDLGTAEGGTLFTVGEEYVTGFLVPKLNGIAQDPTRFSETDKTMGTFTFDVAPDSGWGITVDYGVYCDEDLGLHTPTKQGAGLPKRGTGTIGQGGGDGIRVAVAGRSNGAPRFAWTENILVSSPTWTANNTGLPGTASLVDNLRLDPFNPGTTAYLNVDDVLYKNSAYRTGGSWSSVFDPPGAGGIADIRLTIARPGFLAVLHGDPTGAGGDDLVVSHSHDGGTSFSSIYVSDAAITGANFRGRKVVVGQWDVSFLAVAFKSVSFDFSKSTNTGHTWSSSVEFPTDDFALLLPYQDNSNQQEVFGYNASLIYRSADQGGTFALWSTHGLTLPVLDFSSASTSILWGFREATATSYLSRDKGLTFTTGSFGNQLVYNAALLRDVRWYTSGEESAASGRFVQTSEDFVNFTNRTGNLISGVFTGTTPIVEEIVVDWTT